MHLSIYTCLVLSSSSNSDGSGDIPFWLRAPFSFPLLLVSVLSIDRCDDFLEVRPLVVKVCSGSGYSGSSVSDTGLDKSSGAAAFL